MWAITSTTVSPDDSFIVSATSQEFGSSASAGGRGSGAQTEYAMLSFQTMSDRPCPTLPDPARPCPLVVRAGRVREPGTRCEG